MVANRSRRKAPRVRSLAAKSVPAERAGKVKAGIVVTKLTDVASTRLLNENVVRNPSK